MNTIFIKVFLPGLLVFLNIKNIKNFFVFGSVEEFDKTVLASKQNFRENFCQTAENIILTESELRNLKQMSELERRDFLCNDGILPPVEIQKQLKCRYVDRGIPFLKIAPFKEEEVFLEPRILLFHDVITDEEIDIIKCLAKPKFVAAGFRNVTSGKIEVDTVLRDTKTGWLQDVEHKYVELLSLRIEDMTKLTINTAEQLQVAYYETGGHYRPHYDFAIEEDMELFKHLGTGNRIATVLFYLNNVEKGGHTVFTEINVSLKPKKGAAAFWYNLKPSGERDFLTRHSACPVISGVKWAANKWLHVFGQEFLRPCPWNNKTIVLN